jgi:hypothetical protein
MSLIGTALNAFLVEAESVAGLSWIVETIDMVFLLQG